MPVALLLQKMINTLKVAASTLSPWTDIVPLEATIVERARSAFLMHWFGSRLPFDGLALRAHIANVAELDAQFLAAQRSVPHSQGGPNLTEPLLGFGGMLAGMMMSPAGALTGVSLLLRFSAFSLGVLAAALVWLAVPFLLGWGLIAAPAGTGILVGGGLLAAGGGFALAAALGDRREVRAVFDLFGSLARFMNATVGFLGQLTGPRDEVRNPLLKRILLLGDGFAALMAQMLGAVALLVTRVGPVTESVARTFVGLGQLAGSVMSALGVVVGGLMSRVDELTGGPLSVMAVVDRVIAVARRQLTTASGMVTGQLDVLVAAFTEVGKTLGDKTTEWVGEPERPAKDGKPKQEAKPGLFGNFLEDLFVKHPVVQVFVALADQLGAIMKAFAAIPPKPTPPGGKKPSKIAPLLDKLPSPPSLIPFPDLTLPDTAALGARFGAASVPPLNLAAIERAAEGLGRTGAIAPIELSEEARTAVAALRRRRSVFAPEQKALADALGPKDWVLAVNDQRLGRFQEAFAVIVGRVLPPEFRGTAIPKLVDPAELPVLDLPGSDELRPVVKKLRLRMPGAHINDVKRFQDMVTERIQLRTYRVAPGGR